MSVYNAVRAIIIRRAVIGLYFVMHCDKETGMLMCTHTNGQFACLSSAEHLEDQNCHRWVSIELPQRGMRGTVHPYWQGPANSQTHDLHKHSHSESYITCACGLDLQCLIAWPWTQILSVHEERRYLYTSLLATESYSQAQTVGCSPSNSCGETLV